MLITISLALSLYFKLLCHLLLIKLYLLTKYFLNLRKQHKLLYIFINIINWKRMQSLKMKLGEIKVSKIHIFCHHLFQ